MDSSVPVSAAITSVGLITIALINVRAERARSRDAKIARVETREVRDVLAQASTESADKLDAIKATGETTHRIVNNDHTKLVARLVTALDLLGQEVTQEERREAAIPLTPPTEGE